MKKAKTAVVRNFTSPEDLSVLISQEDQLFHFILEGKYPALNTSELIENVIKKISVFSKSGLIKNSKVFIVFSGETSEGLVTDIDTILLGSVRNNLESITGKEVFFILNEKKVPFDVLFGNVHSFKLV